MYLVGDVAPAVDFAQRHGDVSSWTYRPVRVAASSPERQPVADADETVAYRSVGNSASPSVRPSVRQWRAGCDNRIHARARPALIWPNVMALSTSRRWELDPAPARPLPTTSDSQSVATRNAI